MNVKIKIKKLHPAAKMPRRGTADAAGYDLYAAEFERLHVGNTYRIRTGLAFEIPPGFCGVVYSRSSTALKGLVITPLIVDADYRGEVFVTVHNAGPLMYVVQEGDRLAQLRIERLEPVAFVEAEELSETARGAGGYGSTGR